MEEGTIYVYRVQAVNDGVVGKVSNFVRLEYDEPLPPAPGAPTGLTGGSGVGGVELSWSAADGTVTAYQVLRRRPMEGERRLNVYATLGNQTRYTDGGVEEGTIYVYRVQAVNDGVVGKVSNFVRLEYEEPLPPAPGAPDLLVGTLTLEGDNPVVGASFTLQARVLNQGGAGSGATTVRFYRSDDATITTSDTQVGTSSVSSVAAAGVSSQLAPLTAPSDSGDYHYGACVDTVSGESDTTNNCSGALTVTVEAPDLTAGTPSVSGDDPAAGGSFTLTGTVSNRGGAESAATTLRFYRSDDTTITTSDTEAGTKAVGSLASDGSSDQSIDLTAPSTAGTYYYGACVDTVTGESDTNTTTTARPLWH